jgi:hypothetical protein
MREVTITDASIVLTVRRCWDCGNFWGAEARAGTAVSCPVCAERRQTERMSRQLKAERKVIALRGVITRLRKRRR